MILASNGLRTFVVEAGRAETLTERQFIALLKVDVPYTMFLLDLQLMPSQGEDGKINYGALVNNYASTAIPDESGGLVSKTVNVIPKNLNVAWFKEISPECNLFKTIKTKHLAEPELKKEEPKIEQDITEPEAGVSVLKKALKGLNPEQLEAVKAIINSVEE